MIRYMIRRSDAVGRGILSGAENSSVMTQSSDSRVYSNNSVVRISSNNIVVITLGIRGSGGDMLSDTGSSVRRQSSTSMLRDEVGCAMLVGGVCSNI